MEIDIKGHSGCKIDIIESDENLYVKKSTTDQKYLDRLALQGVKQQTDPALCGCILTPEILELKHTDNECYILMEYIYAKNFIDYFESASPKDIDRFINVFIDYVNSELSLSETKDIDKQIFIDKFNSIVKNCENNELTKNNNRVKAILDDCRENYISKLPDIIKVPIGKCHGDLTFSNILFASNNYYFIDYLDSFIETPIQDIVKLRQDTKYFWSVMMYKKRYDVIRLNMIFKYIDDKINGYFFNNVTSYCQLYDRLQLMNILRILPYVKEEKVRDFVLNILASLPKY